MTIKLMKRINSGNDSGDVDVDDDDNDDVV